MKKRISLLSLCLALTLSGCTSLWQRSYSSVTTHVETSVTEDDPSVLRAEDYQSLVSAILYFVQERADTGTVRLYQYTGDVESDLDSACREVSQEDPLGSYALSGVTHAYSRIVSYYECTFTFNYRTMAAEPASIPTVSNLVALRDQVERTMDAFTGQLVVRTSFSVSEDTLKRMVSTHYYDTPECALGTPVVIVNLYPEVSVTGQIVELHLYYGTSGDACVLRQQELLARAEALTQGVTLDESGLFSLYQSLLECGQVVEEGSNSVHSFLCQGEGNSESAAMTVLLLCRRLGIPCQTVQGTWAETTHWWNVVELDGVWRHLDVAAGDDASTFLRTDEEMPDAYQWDTNTVPPCLSAAGEAPAEEEPVPAEEADEADEAEEAAPEDALSVSLMEP